MSYALSKLPEALRDLHGFGILSDLDIYLTEMLLRRFADNPPSDAALLACALANRVVADGHVCLDLRKVSPEWLVSLAPGEPIKTEALTQQVNELCQQLMTMDADDLIEQSAGIIGDSASQTPIVMEGGLLYLRRYWNYELYVAGRLKSMSEPTGAADLNAVSEERLTALHLDGRQRDAAVAAMSRKLTVISGGPGTGKTYVAARILHLLLNPVSSAGRKPVVRMAAPTGKAAARLDESVRDALEQIAGGDRAASPVFEPACTIERLLGFKPNSPYFKYNQENPLPAGIVLVDEASMIDLPKMAKLLAALPEECRLVLLGDMHQLASVAPGSVMADICLSNSLHESVVELTESRRFPVGSPVHRLGQAVNAASDASSGGAAWQLLENMNGVEYKGPDGKPATRIKRFAVEGHLANREGIVNSDMAAAVIRGYRAFLAAESVKDAFNELAGFRILCALRRGPHGVNTVNGLVKDILSGKAVKISDLPADLQGWKRLKPVGEFYDHRVVMITCNDYNMGLFNGDLGIVLPDESDSNKMVTWFEGRKDDESLRKFPCRLLPEHETAFCTTIHKSQGSEFGHVLVLLPAEQSPILTKELIYTAITRSKGNVDIWANQRVFEEAVARSVERSSGLLHQLNGHAG